MNRSPSRGEAFAEPRSSLARFNPDPPKVTLSAFLKYKDP